jgi:cytochrome c
MRLFSAGRLPGLVPALVLGLLAPPALLVSAADAADRPPDSRFEQVTLAFGPSSAGESIALAVLPDGRALHTSRDGRVFLSEEGVGTEVAGQIPVYRHDEEGLQGIAVAPDFAQSRWVYVMYAPELADVPADDPATPGVNEGDAPTDGTAADFAPYQGKTLVSRFRFEGDSLDLDSEQVILEIAADRGLCCHVGGDLLFDEGGNLLISTGDDTNPFESDGYTPIDERPSRNPGFDAQRSAGNTNDLRGKVLRIHPEPDGSYTVPAGNLFGPDGRYPDVDPTKVRPEIYAMGFRNPFRMGLDPETGWLYVGEYGPDAAAADENRGPGGNVEVMQIREPANYGWPYCAGPNLPYRDYDFATGASGPAFDCANPVNDSPRNTGLRELPPAQHPWIWYDGGTVHYDGKATDEFGAGSESPMAGPVYRYDPDLASDVKFPEYFDGHFFLGEWGRGWIKDITVGAEGQPAAIHPFFDGATIAAPMDFEFGPDGSLYVLDYGSASYGGMYAGGSPDAALYKINYVDGSRTPTARASATPTDGLAPLSVQLSSAGTSDPDGDPLTYAWDFDGDGTTDSTEANPSHVYRENGMFTARLTVTDVAGKSATASTDVVVGNQRPSVELLLPADGGVFDYGDRLPFRVQVSDPQDGEIDCARVRVETALGHNEHAHGDQSFTGCTGTFTVPPRWEPDTQSSFVAVTASYTDDGGVDGTPSLTGADSAILQPRVKQAEHFSSQSGVSVVDITDPAGGGGRAIGQLEDGDYSTYRPVNLTGIDGLHLRVSPGTSGGRVEVRLDAPDGPLVGSVTVAGSVIDTSWRTVDIPIDDPGGTHSLYLVFRNPLVPPNPVAPSSMMLLNFVEFVGTGLDSPPTAAGTATPTSGTAPLAVEFSAAATDPEDTALTYHWDFGVTGAEADTANARYTYRDPGDYRAVLTVTDAAGNTATDTIPIAVAPAPDTTPPTITDPSPADGSVTPDRQPAIGATVRDAASDMTADGIRAYLDGRQVVVQYDATTGRVTYAPTKRLTPGRHDVRVVAEDAAGNLASRSWTFTVAR